SPSAKSTDACNRPPHAPTWVESTTGRAGARSRCLRAARDGRERPSLGEPEELQGIPRTSHQENATMFITYEVSLELIRSLRDVVPAIKKYDKDLADQIQRAASSVTLNLGEGARSTAGNQRARYESAHGSANEVKAALQVAASWGWIDDAAQQLEIL